MRASRSYNLAAFTAARHDEPSNFVRMLAGVTQRTKHQGGASPLAPNYTHRWYNLTKEAERCLRQRS